MREIVSACGGKVAPQRNRYLKEIGPPVKIDRIVVEIVDAEVEKMVILNGHAE
jgi:hypothetical protein